MAELKPCPFCGGTPNFENTDERARLRCSGCGCEGGLFFYSQEECETGIGDVTEARAIAAWNQRWEMPKSMVHRLATQMGWTPPGASIGASGKEKE